MIALVALATLGPRNLVWDAPTAYAAPHDAYWQTTVRPSDGSGENPIMP